MSNLRSFRMRFMTVLPALGLTIVAFAQSEAASALIAAIQVVVNRQPQGF